MKTRIITALLGCWFATQILAQTTNPIAIFPEEDAGTPEDLQLIWSATPGVRYQVEQTGNLTNWALAPGYPAMANGPAQAMPFVATNDALFFRVAELDEQAPAIVAQYPSDGGFAVPRFSKITLQLSDVTGIDTNSIQLTVGTNGTFTLVDAQLTYTNGILTYFDASGNVSLGWYGQTNQSSLIVADTLGNWGTNTWSFQLELQPVVVSNLLVFGSPQAQRMGQRVGAIPTAALAARSGPIRAGDGDPWTLDLVASNRLEITYTNTAPVFTNGQYVCNLTPVTADEIFYRQITSMSDDPGSKRLTLFTVDVPLAEIVEEGSATVSEESVIYELGPSNVIVQALSYDKRIEFDPVGINTNNTVLYDTNGITLTLKEAKCQFTPALDLSFETKLLSLQRFNATLRGRLETALVPELTLQGSLVDDFEFDLYSHKLLVYVGQAGPVPIWLDFNFSVTAQVGYDLQADATFTTGIRKNVELGFGVDYVKGRSPELKGDPYVTPEPTEIVPFTYEINGSAHAYATIVPRLDVWVNSLAGVYADVDPRVEVDGSAAFANGQLTSANICITADADLNVGLSALALGDLPLASFSIFEIPWCTNYPAPASLSIISQPRPQQVVVGGSATFTVNAFGPALTYQWYDNNGTLMSGKTSPTLTLYSVTLGHQGSYRVKVKSGGQSVWSDYATLSVLSPGSSLQSGLVAWYPFDGNANDVSGNGNNATVNGAAPVPGKLGNAFHFDGNDFVEVPHSPSLNLGSRSYSAWIKFSASQPAWAGIVAKAHKSSQASDIVGSQMNIVSQKLAAETFATGSDFSQVTGTATLNDGGWHHVVSVVDLSGGRLQLYSDGLLQTNKSVSWLPTANLANTVPLLIGVDRERTWFFNGTIDEVRIYNRALSESEVLQLYNLSLPPAPSGMALIPAGSFMMGATTNVGHESYTGETPQHTVNVSAFYMDRTEVTKGLWDLVKGWNGGNGYSYDNVGLGKAASHPVQTVSWHDCVKWCNARSQREGLTPCYYSDAGLTVIYKTGQVAPYVKWNANGYRLPTEAEWEKAARGGASGRRFPWGDTIDHSRANYRASLVVPYDLSYPASYHPSFDDGGEPYTSPAGYFPANDYGLHDMAGNVWEWCWDRYGAYSSGTQTDPKGATSGTDRVGRGGAYYDSARSCRVSLRNHPLPNGSDNHGDFGFRCVRSVGQ